MLEDYGADYYAKKHLADLKSRFQRYRAREVVALHNLGQAVSSGWTSRKRRMSGAGGRRPKWSNVVFRVADAKATELEAASFDVVYAADLFERLDPTDSQAVAAEESGK